MTIIPLLFFFMFCCTGMTAEPADTNVSGAASATVLSTSSFMSQKRTAFDSTIESYIEIGTPAGFRTAVDYFTQAGKAEKSGKQFYLTLIAQLLRFLYPLEPDQWYAHTFSGYNSYLDAFNKIEQGHYPDTAGMNTFLEALIPTLIVLRSTDISAYAQDIETRLHRAQALNPKAVLPFYLLGRLYELQSKYAQAEQAYQTAWERDSSCYPAGIQLIRLALQNQNAEHVISIAKQLSERFPHTLELKLLLAQAYYTTDSLSEANTLLQTVLQQEKHNTEAYFLQIRILLKQKDFLSANALLDTYAKKNKTDKTYLLLRAKMLRGWNQNLSEAKAYLEKAEQRYPLDTEVLMACAAMCFETAVRINGKTADDFIALLLKQNPAHIPTIRLLIRQDSAQENWTKAFERAQSLYKTHPSQEHTILYIKTCIGLEKWTEATALAKTAYHRTPKPSDAITALYLETLVHAGEYEALKRVIDSKLSDAPLSLKSILQYYQARMEKNDKKKLSLLRQSFISDPHNVATLFALYEWYFARADYQKAQNYLQQVLILEPANRQYQRLAAKIARILAK